MPLLDTIDQIRSRPHPPNEESTKLQAVLPTLADLGWDTADPERVKYEYEIGAKHKKRRVDIALIGERHVVAFIEVKAPGQKLDDHLDQVLEYAFHVGADICALTDGLEWWFYLPREKGPPSDRRFEMFNLKSHSVDQVADRLQAYLAREELLSHRAERRAKEALGSLRNLKKLQQKIPQIWGEMQDRPDPELVELVTRRVSASTRLQPAPEQIIAVLRGEAVPDAHGLAGDPTSGPPKRSSSKQDSKRSSHHEERQKRKRRKAGRSPTGFRLWGKRHGATTHRAVLLGVAAALFQRHEGQFHKALELRGRKLPWISSDPDKLRAASAIQGSRYFIDVHLSAKSIERRCHGLLATFGYGASELEILFD